MSPWLGAQALDQRFGRRPVLAPIGRQHRVMIARQVLEPILGGDRLVAHHAEDAARLGLALDAQEVELEVAKPGSCSWVASLMMVVMP